MFRKVDYFEKKKLDWYKVGVYTPALFKNKRFKQPYCKKKDLYSTLREMFGLKSQMAQSVFKTVIAKYKKSC